MRSKYSESNLQTGLLILVVLFACGKEFQQRPVGFEVVEAFSRLSKEALVGGSEPLPNGFGKFSVRDKKAIKEGIPDRRGVILKERMVVTFKPSDSFGTD